VSWSAPSVPAGFSAQLRGASLFDLIQFEASSRGRRVVRVTSEGRSALLYFQDGRIVHAVAGGVTGEPAVREMLGWGKGTFARFDHFDGAWPKFETIGASTESVLLRAAQYLDEGAGNLIALPRRDALEAVVTIEARPAPPVLPGHTELSMRLSVDGEVLERQGTDGDPEGFGDVVAYAAALTDLVGELLGLASFDSVDLIFREGKCVVARRPDHTLVAVKAGPRETVEGLRHKLGLDV
jgi:Domain of unknown function (DUF4388)